MKNVFEVLLVCHVEFGRAYSDSVVHHLKRNRLACKWIGRDGREVLFGDQGVQVFGPSLVVQAEPLRRKGRERDFFACSVVLLAEKSAIFAEIATNIREPREQCCAREDARAILPLFFFLFGGSGLFMEREFRDLQPLLNSLQANKVVRITGVIWIRGRQQPRLFDFVEKRCFGHGSNRLTADLRCLSHDDPRKTKIARGP